MARRWIHACPCSPVTPDDNSNEEEEYSEAEEINEKDTDEDDVELNQEQQEALTSRLLELRVRQSQEQQAFIARLEA